MFHINSQTPIYVYTAPTDMRKGFDGLSGIVREKFKTDPTNGSLFLFFNRRRDRIKILHFEQGGFWLYYRLLEKGTFETVTTKNDSEYVVIDTTELTMLLAGVSLASAKKRRTRFKHKQQT